MINCDHHQYVSRHEPKTEQFLEKKVIELHDHLDVNELRIPHPNVIDSNDAYDPLATIHVASFFFKDDFLPSCRHILSSVFSFDICCRDLKIKALE